MVDSVTSIRALHTDGHNVIDTMYISPSCTTRSWQTPHRIWLHGWSAALGSMNTLLLFSWACTGSLSSRGFSTSSSSWPARHSMDPPLATSLSYCSPISRRLPFSTSLPISTSTHFEFSHERTQTVRAQSCNIMGESVPSAELPLCCGGGFLSPLDVLTPWTHLNLYSKPTSSIVLFVDYIVWVRVRWTIS